MHAAAAAVLSSCIVAPHPHTLSSFHHSFTSRPVSLHLSRGLTCVSLSRMTVAPPPAMPGSGSLPVTVESLKESPMEISEDVKDKSYVSPGTSGPRQTLGGQVRQGHSGVTLAGRWGGGAGYLGVSDTHCTALLWKSSVVVSQPDPVVFHSQTRKCHAVSNTTKPWKIFHCQSRGYSVNCSRLLCKPLTGSEWKVFFCMSTGKHPSVMSRFKVAFRKEKLFLDVTFPFEPVVQTKGFSTSCKCCQLALRFKNIGQLLWWKIFGKVRTQIDQFTGSLFLFLAFARVRLAEHLNLRARLSSICDAQTFFPFHPRSLWSLPVVVKLWGKQRGSGTQPRTGPRDVNERASIQCL